MPVRFLCDAMLGDVARWLRLLGFDAEYASSDWTDGDVLRRAMEQDGVLLTRDALLHGQATRAGARSVWLPARELEDDLVAALEGARARPDPAARYTRCSHCNALLERAPADAVAVPERVRQAHDTFWRCPGCGRVYWEGTHVQEIARRLDRVEARLGAAR